MREILNIQIGQCGNAVGSQFWEIISGDHGLGPDGACIGQPDIRLERVNVFFIERKGLRYCARSVMIDLDKTSMDGLRSTTIGQIFKPDNFAFGSRGTGNNWAKGHFSEGAQLCDISLDIIRKEVEACDCFYGFQTVHSIGGGTGAGLGSLLMDKLKDEYPSNMLSSYSVLPSSKVSASVVEPYNSLLTINHLIESTDETFCTDNGALYNIAANTLKIKQAAYCDLNYLVSLAMTGVTSSLRFPGPSDSSLRKIAVNMIPFPRMHFFAPSFAPILSRNNVPYRKCTIGEITGQIFDYKNLHASCETKTGKFLTVAVLYRGEIQAKEVDQQVSQVQNRTSSQFVEWIPDNVKTGICQVPIPGITKTATFIGNTTAFQDLFKAIKENYLTMFKRKAFVHWYTGEGLDEMEFTEAETNLNELIEEYQKYEKETFNEPVIKNCQ